MSAYSDQALKRASGLLADLYESVRTSFPNFIVHELQDSVGVARAYLTAQATDQDREMLEGWTGSVDPFVWTEFCNGRFDMHHTYRMARMVQGNLYRQLAVDVNDKSDAEVNTLMLTWCETVEAAIDQLPVSESAKANALHEIVRLKSIYGAD